MLPSFSLSFLVLNWVRVRFRVSFMVMVRVRVGFRIRVTISGWALGVRLRFGVRIFQSWC